MWKITEKSSENHQWYQQKITEKSPIIPANIDKILVKIKCNSGENYQD